MMSFLFIDSERVWRGGQEQLFTLLKGLLRRGHDLHLACYPQTLLEERARALGLPVYPIHVWSEIGLVSFWRILSIMRRVNPDLVAFNTPRPIVLGSLASRLAGVRARIVFRRVSFPLRRNPITRLKYTWGIDCVVAISGSIGHQLQQGGVPPSRIQVVYEGIELANYARRDFCDPRVSGRPIVVGTLAHLSREKGHYYLLQAASLIRNVSSRMRFVIVGDGSCRQELEAQARELDLERCVQFTGFQGQPTEYLSGFDIFVLPSLSEGLSSAILSAMASGLPVIATNVGGIPELVRSEENGLLVPPADPAALAQAIQYLSENPEAAFRMGERGRRRVEEHFTLERKILETEELCLNILHSHAPISGEAHA